MNTEYLKYFYHVVKENGFTRAAEKIHIHQPVLSRAIKLLEEQLGCKLLERQRKQVLLTVDGEYLYKIATKIFSKLDEADYYFSSERNLKQLSLACSDSISNLLIDLFYGSLKKETPQFKLEHYTGSAKLFLDDIENGKIDLGVFFNVPELRPNLAKTKICDVDFYYTISTKCAKDSSIVNSFIASSSGGSIAPEELPLFKIYKKYNKDAQISLISNSSLSRKEAVLKNHGTSILPKFLVDKEIRNKTLTVLHKPEKLALYVIERQSSYRNPIKNKLFREIENLVNSK